MDEEVEPIINDCPIECKVLVSIEELLYTEAGPPSDMLVDQEKVKEREMSSKDDFPKTQKNFEDELQFQEGRTRRRIEQGEVRNTPNMEDDQASHILVMITTATTESQVQLEQHSTKYFHQVKGLLQSLMNVILEKVPQVDVL